MLFEAEIVIMQSPRNFQILAVDIAVAYIDPALRHLSPLNSGLHKLEPINRNRDIVILISCNRAIVKHSII
jgi:hypothetical protein